MAEGQQSGLMSNDNPAGQMHRHYKVNPDFILLVRAGSELA